nr:hypothetical protein [Caproicibacter fermentans]
MLITPSAFYHIVTNFSIGSVFGAQVICIVIAQLIQNYVTENNTKAVLGIIFMLFGLAFIGYGVYKGRKVEGQEYLESLKNNKNSVNTHSQDLNHVPCCPTCGSINIEKISGVSKAGKAVAFGVLAAGSISKTFHCKNCGYKW